jgi:Mrp family chromosome partitioning ATPase
VPEVQTVLRIDSTPGDAVRARALVEEAGGAVVADEAGAAGPLVAAFHVAADAALAAVRVAAALDATGRPRMALATGEIEVARRRVDALAGLDLATGDDAVALLAASAAVMVTHGLPPGADLVDRGSAPLAGPVAERVYELRWSAVDPAGGDGAAASNLGWARRAAARLLVGRDEQVARLEAAWEAAQAGERRVAVVTGDPGIGKTTVAAELALRVHAGGGTVLYGRWDEEGLAPYQALREALGTYATACPRPLLRADVAQHAGELARLLPDIGARIGGVRPPLADDPDAERLRLFDAVRHWLGAIAARRPVLLVLDDLQWVDRSSLLLLRHVLDSPPAGPMMVVLTTRDGDVEGTGPLHRVASLEGGSLDRIDVGGLGADDVRQLVGQALGRPVGEDESEVTAWLATETAGNPLFLHEILRGLDPVDPAAALRAARDRLPERVHDVVRWRLSGLSPAVEDAVAAASLIGEEFPLDVLATAVGVGELDLRHRIDDAARAGVVREVGDGRHAAFTHAVIRRTLQDHVGPDQAAALHRRIAEALAARDGAAAAEVAHHYLQAADAATAPLAVRWARAAADQARIETAFEGAVWFLSRAVDVHDDHGASGTAARELDCELRLDLADAHDRAGEFIARDRRHLEAAALARDLDRIDLFTRAALGYGGRLPAAPPSNPRARELLEQVLARLPSSDSRARALALARLAHVRHGDAPHAEREALADEAEAMARRLDAPVVLASVLCSRVLALDGPDDLDEHLDIGAEVIRIGEQTGDQDLVLQGARARIQPLFALGAHDAARDLADRFAQLAATVRHPDHLRLATMWRIMWAGLQGRFAQAEAEAGELRDRLEAAGHPQAGNLHAAETFVHRWLQGTLAGATPGIEGEEQLSPAGFAFWAMHMWALAGVGHAESLVRNLRARDPAELASVDASYNWLMAVVGMAVAASSAGDTAWAQAAYDALAPYSGRNCVMGYAAYLGAVDHHLGTLAAVTGRPDEAVEHLLSARERHRTIEARPWVALSAAWAANVLAARDGPGDPERSASLHAEAAALATELDMSSLPAPHARLAT